MRPRRRWGTQFRHSKIYSCRQGSNDSREGDDHFITFSCYRRETYFAAPASKDIFLDSLELTRKRQDFEVLGYVVIPEHVHLLVSAPLDYKSPLSKALQSLQLSVSQRLAPRPFWQAPLLRLQCLHPQQAGRKVEVHAPQPSHPRSRRET